MDVFCTGVSNRVDEDATKLDGRQRAAPVKGVEKIVLVTTILFLLYLQGRKKTSDELDADYIPNDEEVNRNMPTIF